MVSLSNFFFFLTSFLVCLKDFQEHNFFMFGCLDCSIKNFTFFSAYSRGSSSGFYFGMCDLIRYFSYIHFYYLKEDIMLAVYIYLFFPQIVHLKSSLVFYIVLDYQYMF